MYGSMHLSKHRESNIWEKSRYKYLGRVGEAKKLFDEFVHPELFVTEDSPTAVAASSRLCNGADAPKNNATFTAQRRRISSVGALCRRTVSAMFQFREHSDNSDADLIRLIKKCMKIICADIDELNVEITDDELSKVTESGEPSKLKPPPHT